MAHFIAITEKTLAEGLAKLFRDHIWRLHGIMLLVNFLWNCSMKYKLYPQVVAKLPHVIIAYTLGNKTDELASGFLDIDSVMNIKWNYNYYQPQSDNKQLVNEMLAMLDEDIIMQ